MKLNALRDFLTVAERGGLRAAARQLGLPQPALTRSIQELEKELGVPLFERSAKGVTLTPMGSAFLRRANAVRSELQKAKDEIDQLRGQTHGSLRVCLLQRGRLAGQLVEVVLWRGERLAVLDEDLVLALQDIPGELGPLFGLVRAA